MQPSNKLLKYKIGIGVIAVFVAVVFLIVLAQASSVKQDAATYDQASKISDKLNQYVDGNSRIPDTLAEAKINNVPKTVSYRRVTDTKYEFCVTYHSNSSSFSATDVEMQLLYGGSSSNYDYNSNSGGQPPAELYIDTTHHKGKNCQTIQPYFYKYDDSSSTTSDSTSATTATTPYVKNSDGTYTVCGVHTNYFSSYGHVTQTTAVTPGSISIDAISYPYAGARQLYMIKSDSKVFDAKCNPLQPSDMHLNDLVNVFDITSANTDATSIFVKMN